jgi:ABC-type glycerol-3-phosphate transport system substrate-binding protein
MISLRKLVIAVAAVAVALGLAGCGEKDQVIAYHQGKYQGKPDTPPWDNAPSASIYTTSTWTKGDKASWERAINSRTQYQNEYTRVE